MVFISIQSTSSKEEVLMTVPISLASRLATFIFMAIIPFAAFFGAYVFDDNSRIKNIVSFTIGLIAVVGLIVVISINT